MAGFAGVMFMVVGLSFTVLGIQQLTNGRRFARRGLRAPGEVVEMQVRRSRSRLMGHRRWRPSAQMLYFPVVRFRPPSGPPVTFLSPTGTNPAQFHVGSEVTVVYDPSNPFSARVESFLSDTAFPVFLAVIGLLFAAFGALFLLVAT